jgi:sulfotransferase
MKKIFFNSSMPRSGSTLLQNILGNHPEIYSTPTSPLFDYLAAAKKSYTKSVVTKAQNSDDMKSAFLTFCRYAIHGFFDGLTDKDIVLEKSRAWLSNKDFLQSFYPEAKIIVLVRDLREILASMEKNYRKHPDKDTFPVEAEINTIGDRVTFWMNPRNKPVGSTLNNLLESIHRGFHKENVLFIKFEDLSNHPQEIMNIVHKFLGLENYKYDFDNIKQVTFEDDKFHGIYGDHKIKNKVIPVSNNAKQILGETICNQIYEKNKWYFQTFKYEK